MDALDATSFSNTQIQSDLVASGRPHSWLRTLLCVLALVCFAPNSLVAQDENAPAKTGAAPAEGGEEEAAPPVNPGGDLFKWMIPALLIFFMFQMFFSSSPARKEQKHIDQLKTTLKKNDPVVTAGGIMGTVANVSPEKGEVTIKVDDNTKLRVQMRSVIALSQPDSKGGKAKDVETPKTNDPAENA